MDRCRPAAGAALFFLLSGVAGAAAQVVEAGPLVLDFSGRVQVQLNTTSVDAVAGSAEVAESAFELRRTRLGADFVFDGWLSGKLEAELTGPAARLTDAYIDVPLGAGVAVRAGQFKKPFGIIELESSTRTPMIERGVRIRGLPSVVDVPGETQWLLEHSGYVGRDVGVMLRGGTGGVSLAAGVFNGEGANTREAAGTKAFALRAAYAIGAKLEVGGGLSVQPGSVAGEADVHGTVWGVDASWGGFRQEGLRVMAEAMVGDNPLTGLRQDARMRGAHAVASWFAPRQGRVDGIEPLLRVSWADPDTGVESNEGALLTPGVNLYFGGGNRLMLNTEMYLPSGVKADPCYAAVAQLQIHF